MENENGMTIDPSAISRLMSEGYELRFEKKMTAADICESRTIRFKMIPLPTHGRLCDDGDGDLFMKVRMYANGKCDIKCYPGFALAYDELSLFAKSVVGTESFKKDISEIIDSGHDDSTEQSMNPLSGSLLYLRGRGISFYTLVRIISMYSQYASSVMHELSQVAGKDESEICEHCSKVNSSIMANMKKGEQK